MAVITTKDPIRFKINGELHELHGTEVTINCTSTTGGKVKWWVEAPQHVRFERMKKPPHGRPDGGGGQAW